MKEVKRVKEMRMDLDKVKFLNRQEDDGFEDDLELRSRERESFGKVIRVVLDYGWGFQNLNKEIEILKKIQRNLANQISLIKNQINRTTEITNTDSILIEPFLKLYNLLDSDLNSTSNILELTKQIKSLIFKPNPPISSIPFINQTLESLIPELKTIEGSGLSEIPQSPSSYPEPLPGPSFDMKSLKSLLKPHNCKVLYKQVSESGSVIINEKPSSPKITSQASQIPSFPSLSFKDFLQSRPNTLITLEALGENSDSDL